MSMSFKEDSSGYVDAWMKHVRDSGLFYLLLSGVLISLMVVTYFAFDVEYAAVGHTGLASLFYISFLGLWLLSWPFLVDQYKKFIFLSLIIFVIAWSLTLAWILNYSDQFVELFHRAIPVLLLIVGIAISASALYFTVRIKESRNV